MVMMEFRKLGNSGLKVSEVGLGGNNFGARADEKTSVNVINHALDIGVNFIDTAPTYDQGHSEEYIGKAIKGKRNQVIIATKFGSMMNEVPSKRGSSRYSIMDMIDASLKRLQTDYIDLYQMHLPDPYTSMDETLRTLDDLVREGKVRYIGCSNFGSWQIAEALWKARVNNLHSFVTVQIQYNLLGRKIEEELIPCCQVYNIGVIPHTPLAGGFLTGKYLRGEELSVEGRLAEPNSVYRRILTETNWDKLTRLNTFAKERGHTVGELAIAWLLAKQWITTVIAGAKMVEQVSANVIAAEWKLTKEEVAEVDAMT
jgi:aryl-alcohol dehydrogenase-like predicted oxidoreductase